MDPDKDRFPYCLVWTPIPLLSWMCPLIGHMGICDSLGRVHDFAASNHINIDRMSFGRPALFSLPPLINQDRWDDGITIGDTYFRGQKHSLLSSNCHHHVGRCLREIGLQGGAWGAWLLFWRHVRVAPNRSAFVGLFLPTICTYLIICILVHWLKAT